MRAPVKRGVLEHRLIMPRGFRRPPEKSERQRKVVAKTEIARLTINCGIETL